MLNEVDLVRDNTHLRDRVEELEETVRQLRAASQEQAPLPAWLPYLTNNEEAVLRLFIARDTVTMDALLVLLGDVTSYDSNLLRVYVFKLRHKLGPHGVTFETYRSRGYRMSAASKALFAQRSDA